MMQRPLNKAIRREAILQLSYKKILQIKVTQVLFKFISRQNSTESVCKTDIYITTHVTAQI